MADDGTVVVAGGLSRVNPDGSDSDGSSELYRFKGDGNQLGTPRRPTAAPRRRPARLPAEPGSGVARRREDRLRDLRLRRRRLRDRAVDARRLDDPQLPEPDAGSAGPLGPDLDRQHALHVLPRRAAGFGAHWGEHRHGCRQRGRAGPSRGEGHARPKRSSAATARWRPCSSTTARLSRRQAAATSTSGSTRTRHAGRLQRPGLPRRTCKFPLDASKLSDIDHLSPSLSPDGSKVLFGDNDGVK